MDRIDYTSVGGSTQKDIEDAFKDGLEVYDAKHNAFVSLTCPQKMMCDGRVFSASHLESAITDGSSVELPFITGSKNAKYISRVKSTGQCEIEFEKGTTFSDEGTEIPSINRNETSSNTSLSKVYHGPTIDTSGTVFSEDFIPGASGLFSTQGGETSIDVRYLIEANTNHLLRITNTSGSDSKIYVKGIWIE